MGAYKSTPESYVARALVCPRCNAPVGERCTTTTGNKQSGIHTERFNKAYIMKLIPIEQPKKLNGKKQ